MSRLAPLVLAAAALLSACGGESEQQVSTARFSFLELPTPAGWVSGNYVNLSEANFALFPYPTQNELALNLFSRGANGAWSTVSASPEGVVSDWIVAASFARPADELILPAFTADLRDGTTWEGEPPQLTKVSDTEFSVSGETSEGHRYIRAFMDETTIVVVIAGTSAEDHDAFEEILALATVAGQE